MSLEDMEAEARAETDQGARENEQAEAESRTLDASKYQGLLIMAVAGVGQLACRMFRREPLTERQVLEIAGHSMNVAAQYDLPPLSPKTEAWAGLVGVIAGIALTQRPLPPDIEAEAGPADDTAAAGAGTADYAPSGLDIGGSGYAAPTVETGE